MKQIKLVISNQFFVKVLKTMTEDFKLFCIIKIGENEKALPIKRIDIDNGIIICDNESLEIEIQIDKIQAINIKSGLPMFIIGE